MRGFPTRLQIMLISRQSASKLSRVGRQPRRKNGTPFQDIRGARTASDTLKCNIDAFAAAAR